MLPRPYELEWVLSRMGGSCAKSTLRGRAGLSSKPYSDALRRRLSIAGVVASAGRIESISDSASGSSTSAEVPAILWLGRGGSSGAC